MKLKVIGMVLATMLAIAVGAQAATHTVQLDGSLLKFVPDSIKINSGDVVHWVVISGIHTTTNGTGATDPQAGVLWDHILSGAGASFDRTFNGAGVFPYFCRPHEAMGMKGKIVVVANVPLLSPGSKAGLVGLILLLGGVALWRRRVAVRA